MKDLRKQVTRRDYLLGRMAQMEQRTASYASMASQENYGPMRVALAEKARVYINRYLWYLTKLINL